eukprot:208463-Pleurochrysis_carterae.AAC.1
MASHPMLTAAPGPSRVLVSLTIAMSPSMPSGRSVLLHSSTRTLPSTSSTSSSLRSRCRNKRSEPRISRRWARKSLSVREASPGALAVSSGRMIVVPCCSFQPDRRKIWRTQCRCGRPSGTERHALSQSALFRDEKQVTHSSRARVRAEGSVGRGAHVAEKDVARWRARSSAPARDCRRRARRTRNAEHRKDRHDGNRSVDCSGRTGASAEPLQRASADAFATQYQEALKRRSQARLNVHWRANKCARACKQRGNAKSNQSVPRSANAGACARMMQRAHENCKWRGDARVRARA